MKNTPSKFSLLIIVVFFVSTFALWLWQFHWESTTIHLSDTDLTVLLAKTPKQWHKGVGGRETLAPYDGMLFLFGDSRRQGIVMRDTLLPLDIIWIERGKVVDMAPNVATEIGIPEEKMRIYYPRADANIVLEVPAGWLQKHPLKIGDTLSLPE